MAATMWAVMMRGCTVNGYLSVLMLMKEHASGPFRLDAFETNETNDSVVVCLSICLSFGDEFQNPSQQRCSTMFVCFFFNHRFSDQITLLQNCSCCCWVCANCPRSFMLLKLVKELKSSTDRCIAMRACRHQSAGCFFRASYCITRA